MPAEENVFMNDNGDRLYEVIFSSVQLGYKKYVAHSVVTEKVCDANGKLRVRVTLYDAVEN